MNADRLMEVYEQISEAPDAIARLRRFVLDLAVRGKLVEQHAEDEPANSLIKDIAARRAISRVRKKGTVLPVPFNGELYQLPEGWAWIALMDLSDVNMGQSPPGSTYNKAGDGVPLINGPVEFTEGPFGRTVVNQYTTQPTNFCEAGDFLVCVRGSTTGRTNVAAFRACIGRGVAAIRSDFDDGFIRLFLWKSREDIIGMGRGIAFPSVSKKQLEQLAIPLPPLAEQHRIVAKVDELMALCDRLEEARKTREETRDKLTAASLARLTAPDIEPEDFPAHAAFTLESLPALTTRPDQIKTLRQTILNLAVRGKLVEQDPADELASELLKQIEAEKSRLVEEGEIRKSKPLPCISPDATPFAMPLGWAWARLGTIIDLISGQHLQPHEYTDDRAAGLPYITGPSDFGTDGLVIRRHALVRKAVATRGQLLLTVKGSGVGKATICDIDEVAISRQLMALTAISWEPAFLELVADRLATELQKEARSLIPGISREDVTRFIVALPPLAEQHRIVAKVDALMALCDRLEAALTTTDTTRTRLLEALLHEALEPASEVLEAAE